VPLMTGPASLGEAPVNHVLPAWDLLTGAYGAFALLAAERRRRQTGQGQEIRLPLADVALTTLGNLGQIAEVMVNGDRPRMGNDLYGAFGRDFATKDGQRLMIVAISGRQWTGLVEALGLGEAVNALEAELGVSFARDEGVRFTWRERLNPLVEAAVKTRATAELAPVFDRLGVCWGPYHTVKEGLADPRVVAPDTPVLNTVTHPSGYSYPTTGPAADLAGQTRGTPLRAPRLGEHTDEVLAEVLGLSSGEIGRLHDQGLVASDKALAG